MSTLLQFCYLQLLDVLTTVAFLLHGVHEANPIVRTALAVGAPPGLVLLAVKVPAMLLAIYCVRNARLRVLARTNIFFALLIAWNVAALIVCA